MGHDAENRRTQSFIVLGAASREPVPYEQDNQRADGGGDEAGALVRPVPADCLADEGGNERTCDSQQCREEEPPLVYWEPTKAGERRCRQRSRSE